MAGPTARNDEPTSDDRLNRVQFASGFARLAQTCETPLVIGLYGTWGVGKSSLMQLIREKLDTKKTRAVWFNPWQHQFDESPAVALVQTIVHELNLSNEARDTVIKIARAIVSGLLNKVTGINVSNLEAEEKEYEERQFRLREEQMRLQEHFRELIKKAKGGEETRIVFFIDDLDRCMPQQCLRMLEALKLYLNVGGCVYFLGVDRDALQASIKHHYSGLDLREGKDYLDKIVQLPFTIPPIEPGSMGQFIDSLLPDELKSCGEILAAGLGDNPRDVKRFINTLSLNYQFDTDLDAEVLAALLLVQYRQPGLYKIIANQKELFPRLKEKTDETKTFYEEFLDRDEALKKVVSSVDIAADTDLDRYFYLTKAASVTEEVAPQSRAVNLKEILEKHRLWVTSGGKEGVRADLSRANLFGANLIAADLTEAILIWANLNAANLSGANVIAANLFGANLIAADLSRAKLSAAKLTGANLIGANLSGADLSAADLRGANLNRADLTGTTIADEQLSHALTDEWTTLPDGSKGPFRSAGEGGRTPLDKSRGSIKS